MAKTILRRLSQVLTPDFLISRNLSVFAFVLTLALVTPWLGYLGGLELEGRQTLFILTLAVGLWMTGAIPPFAVSLLIVGFQIFFLGYGVEAGGDEALERYTRAWASPVIWLLMGGFFLSLSLSITKIDRDLAQIAIKKFGHNNHHFLLGMMLSTALMSMFISNTASTAMMLAILTPIFSHPHQLDSFRKSLLVGIPAGASVGGMGTLIGSTPNAIVHSHLTAMGEPMEFLSWMKFGLPIMLIFVFLLWRLLIRFYRLPKEVQFLDTEAGPEEAAPSDYPAEKLRLHRWIVGLTFVSTVTLWISAPLHTLSVSVVSFVPIIALTITGVIQSADIRKLPWDTLLLIMGGMSLGDSVVESGLAHFLIDQIDLAGMAPVILMLTFGYIAVWFSNLMSNTAAAAILVPMSTIIVSGHEVEVAITIALCASMATLLPVSTPPNAISFATGKIKSKDFAVPGLFLSFFGPPIVTAILWFWL